MRGHGSALGAHPSPWSGCGIRSPFPSGKPRWQPSRRCAARRPLRSPSSCVISCLPLPPRHHVSSRHRDGPGRRHHLSRRRRGRDQRGPPCATSMDCTQLGGETRLNLRGSSGRQTCASSRAVGLPRIHYFTLFKWGARRVRASLGGQRVRRRRAGVLLRARNHRRAFRNDAADHLASEHERAAQGRTPVVRVLDPLPP